MILLNSNEIAFPDPRFYQSGEGPLAIGGDLSPARLWLAYQNGIFPWYNPGEDILWWSPDPRFVLFPERVKVSKSMRKILNSKLFTFTKNQCFRQVMECCRDAERIGQDGTWISEELIDSFEKLHQAGLASSFEAWQNGVLVGGFYGVEAGSVFCGESMFAKVSNASKAAFLHFVLHEGQHYRLIDCQIHSAHLESLGAEMISLHEYLDVLQKQPL